MWESRPGRVVRSLTKTALLLQGVSREKRPGDRGTVSGAVRAWWRWGQHFQAELRPRPCIADLSEALRSEWKEIQGDQEAEVLFFSLFSLLLLLGLGATPSGSVLRPLFW